MVFIEVDESTKNVTYRHFTPFDDEDGLNKTEEELLQEGFLVDSIPEPKQIEGKTPVLKYDGTKLYYEYVDAPIDEMTALKAQVDALNIALAQVMGV